MRFRLFRISLAVFAFACALALGTRSVSAADGMTIQTAGGVMKVAAFTTSEAIIFSYSKSCGDDGKPCFTFQTGVANEPSAIVAPGCKPVQAGQTECPADGVSSIDVHMAPGGQFMFNDGSRHSECSPAPLTIHTGEQIAIVDVWNGCSETIQCEVKTTVATVTADTADTVKGKCFGVERH